ncbi:MAG TPA: flavin reductase family protein [Rhizobiaceae bacterium]|nr:flavin reductase family protein [Rhizobiaceae bacterium]
MFFEPAKGHGLPHDPFKAIVAPRPIGWISTQGKDGSLNLSPYSYFNAFSTHPHLVWFASGEGSGDSETFAQETGEFVVNIVGRSFFDKMVATSVNAPRGVSEFDYAGLEMEPSRLKPPRVKGVPAALECKLTEVFRPKGRDGKPSGATVVAGEAIGVYIDDAMLTDGLFDIVKAGNVARLGYMDYTHVAEIYAKRRPRWKAD